MGFFCGTPVVSVELALYFSIKLDSPYNFASYGKLFSFSLSNICLKQITGCLSTL